MTEPALVKALGAEPPVKLSDGSWRFACVIAGWADGDTVHVDTLEDHGFGRFESVRRTVRLLGVNTDEKNDKDPVKRARAKAAHEFVLAAAPVGSHGYIELVEYREKYGRDLGRYLGRYLVAGGVLDGGDIGARLLAAGLADPYDGGAR